MRAPRLHPAPLLALGGLLVVACGGTLGSQTASETNAGGKPFQGKAGHAPGDAVSEDELETTQTEFATVASPGDALGRLPAGAGGGPVAQGGGPTAAPLYLPGVGLVTLVSPTPPKVTTAPAATPGADAAPTATAGATASATAGATAQPTAVASPSPTPPTGATVELIAAVGYGGYRAVSFDGWNFSLVSDRDASNDDFFLFRDVVVAGGRICAVGGGTSVPGSGDMARWASSPDGRAWKEGADPGQWFGGVQYVDGWYVAIGGFGRTVRSRDCSTWTETRAADFSRPHMRTLQVKDGVLVAHGDQGVVISSSDKGATWRSGDGGTGLAGAGKKKVTALGSSVDVEWKRLRVMRGGQIAILGSDASPEAVHSGFVGRPGPSADPTPGATPSPFPTTALSPSFPPSPSPSPSPSPVASPPAPPAP